MKKTKYDISVIIPVYNTEKWVEDTIKSVLKQKYDISKIQLVIVNDGSPDNSDAIISKYAEKYDNILYVNKENEGLSKTRNLALSLSKGRYILFLDSDDTISSDTVQSIVPFFDEHYDEIDLVSYKLIPIRDGKELKQHYRQRYLTKTGIYDLTEKNNWFASVTTMNYCIKNKFENNIKFDTTPGFYHEDQKFSMDIIKEKMKIGFVENGTYWYLQQPQSVTKTKFHAYYLFETTISFWEKFFSQFKNNVPEYYQALFINDINWKNRAGIFMPYQFEGKEFEKQINRVKKLLSMVNDEVIMGHPGVAFYHKFYWLDLKDNKKSDKKVLTYKNAIAIEKDNQLMFAKDLITIDVLKFKVENGKINMLLCIKSPAFLYDDEQPKVVVYFDNEEIKKEIFEVRESSYSYFDCKEKCAKFYISEVSFSNQDIEMFKFSVLFHNNTINGYVSFASGNVFSDKLERYDYLREKHIFHFSPKKNIFYITPATFGAKAELKINNFLYYLVRDRKRFFARILATIIHPHKEIWLYYDCKGVKKDNGYYQFIHDIEKNDGIKRYYVTNNDKNFNKGLFKGKAKRRLIKFKSIKHKMYYLRASKIITAYVENENCSPYTVNSFTYFADIANIPELIYLQHGILHAHLPWKYSFDRLRIDKEVISTYYEKENFIKNYCFTEEHLIDSGMPRYDFLTTDVEKTNTILYAPSWRSYLVGNQASGYAKQEKEFKSSEFYIESKKFLESEELNNLLEKYDYVLNFKLHPIFKKYGYLYNIKSKRIKIDADYSDSEYKIFITDFSSYVFDFIYTKSAIIYFVPDYTKFKSGMNLYRELDFKFENGIGDFTQDSESTIKKLEIILKNNGLPSKDKLEKMDNFFIHNDHNQRDRIYDSLISSKKGE